MQAEPRGPRRNLAWLGALTLFATTAAADLATKLFARAGGPGTSTERWGALPIGTTHVENHGVFLGAAPGPAGQTAGAILGVLALAWLIVRYAGIADPGRNQRLPWVGLILGGGFANLFELVWNPSRAVTDWLAVLDRSGEPVAVLNLADLAIFIGAAGLLRCLWNERSNRSGRSLADISIPSSPTP